MKKLVAGVDIGGTYTTCALVDEFGKIYASDKFRTTDFTDFSLFVAAIKDTITELSVHLAEQHVLEVIGIGAPNGNYYTGEIEHAANLIWKGKLPLAKELSNLFDGIKVIVTNDANAAAIGEMMYGAAKGMKNFVLVTLGIGLGSGIVIDGNVVYGHDGFAGELGHIRVVHENGRTCGCGRTGCLETYASATGLKRTAVELMGQTEDPSKLRDIPVSKLTSNDIILAANAGDMIARKTFNITGEILGEALSNLVALISPEAIFLFGELSQAGDLILVPTKKAMEQNLMPLWKNKIKLIMSSIDCELAPILGASALAVKELQKKYAFFERRRVV